MRINLLCSRRNLPENLFQEQGTERWAGIDRGALILLEEGIKPCMAIGDFDSISEQERDYLESHLVLNPHKSEKDDTDLALGVMQAVEEGYTEINIYGATGGRLDHFMGVLQILEKPEYEAKNIAIQVKDATNVITYLGYGEHKVKRDKAYQYISFLPVMYPTVISLEHFKYALDHQQLNVGSTLTVSNELLEPEGQVTLHYGGVLMIRSRDAK